MGSRIMHAIIGNKIATSLSIEGKDKTSFLLGSIAPDAVYTHEEKNVSHFMVGEVKDDTRSVNYKEFLKKYATEVEKKDPYVLGYCTHLIADDIWLRGFNLSWLRNRMDADEGLYKLYHQDFRLLNGKLLEYYDVTGELSEAFSDFSTMIDLEEVHSKDVEKFVPYVLSDMEYDKKVVNEKLNVFTFNQIIGYLETSVNVGLINIKPILTKYIFEGE